METLKQLKAIRKLLAEGKRVAWLTLVRARGSTPREAGATMILRSDGSTLGTIGGGGLEAAAVDEARQALTQGRSRFLSYTLREDQEVDLCMVCGGEADVFVEVLHPSHPQDEVLAALIDSLAAGQSAALATLVRAPETFSERTGVRLLVSPEGPGPGDLAHPALRTEALAQARTLLSRGASQLLGYRLVNHETLLSCPVDQSEIALFVDIIHPQPALLIVGGGHIGLPLAQLARLLGYHVAIYDDRPEFASPARFPEADELVVGPYPQVFDRVPVNPSTGVVIITRGHKHDQTVLARAIQTPAAYIGMIGSRRKVRLTMEALRQAGADEEALARIHAPVGLDIGAETPEEIALAIMAEIVMARRGGTGQPLCRLSRQRKGETER